MRSTMRASGSGTGTHLYGTRSFAQALAPLREKERAAGPQLSEPIQLNIPQQPHPPSQPAAAEQEIEDEDVQMRESSPDPLDNWDSDAVRQCDALIGNTFAQLAEEDTAFTLQEV